MTNIELIARKLAVLEEPLQRLGDRRPAELEAFKADTLLQDAVSLGVLVVVQEALDIALHIASDEGWEMAPTYREAFVVLQRHGLLDERLVTALGGANELRNRIAHGYSSLDVERLWTELPDGIAAFSEFTARIAAFSSGMAPNA